MVAAWGKNPGLVPLGPETHADTIAQGYWDIHTKRDGAEHPYAAA